MIVKLAWRNIWRSPIRSFVVMGSVIVGVWSLVVILSYSYGVVNGYVKNAISNQTSHIQIHHPSFGDDMDIAFTLPENSTLDSSSSMGGFSYSKRAVVSGMISTTKGARGVTIKAIEPEKEKAVTTMHTEIVEGEYLTEDKKNQLILGASLAEKLGLKVRKKAVIQFQDKEGNVIAGSFRVVGIFDSGNRLIDDAQIYIKKGDLENLIGTATTHEMAVLLSDPDELGSVQQALTAAFPDLQVESYREISPDVKLYETQIGTSSMIFITIFMLALIFGIINTMLMAILERTRELGMLMSIGMNKIRLFFMIVLETVFLACIGAPFGLFIGWLTVKYFAKNGFDLSAFADGLKQFNIESIIYPSIEPTLFFQLSLGVIITAILASIYPALRAIRLRPVEAIRKL